MTPTVSVVMAAKNYARFIAQAVRSVFAQTFTDWELVIVDDGSTDDTPAVVKPFLSDPRVKYHRSDKLGQPRAKNLGLRFSRGELVAYLDADDAWEPTKLAAQVELMRARPEVGVCHTRRRLMDENGRVAESLRESAAGATEGVHRGAEGVGTQSLHGGPPCRSPRPDSRRESATLAALFLANPVCFSSVMVRRQVFDHLGGFDPDLDLAIDYDLWLRVARHWQFAEVPEALVLYRTGHGSLSKKLADRVATACSIMARHADGLPPAVVAEGYSSTCNTLGWVLKTSDPVAATRWYARGLAWGGERVRSLKGLAAAGLRWASGRRAKGSAENARENL